MNYKYSFTNEQVMFDTKNTLKEIKEALAHE